MSQYKATPDSVESMRDATFLGWQKKLSGELFPLYNVTVQNHPFYRSTVSEATLLQLGLRVPPAASPYSDAGPAPWHNLGVELNYPATAREAVQQAGLNYIVEKRQMESKTGMKHNVYWTVRSDTDDALGLVDKHYEPIQNADAFAFFDMMIASGQALYETAGILGKGEAMWILARLTGYINVHGDDIVSKYLLLVNSHDSRTQVRVKVTPIRVVCNNTLTAALQGSGDMAVGHGPDAVYSGQLPEILEETDRLYEQLDNVFNKMADRKITDEQLRGYVHTLVPDSEEGVSTAEAEKIRNSVLQLHDSGRGASLARGTVWGAFNSVVEYADYMMLDEKSATRLNSIWFGRAEYLKSRAFRLAGQLMRAEVR